VQDQQGRVVERRDRHDHAAGLTHREADLVQARSGAGIQGQRVAVQLRALEGREPDDFPGSARLAGGLGDRLADFRADRAGDLGGSLVGELRRP
jgi:hypothetical protein